MTLTVSYMACSSLSESESVCRSQLGGVSHNQDILHILVL